MRITATVVSLVVALVSMASTPAVASPGSSQRATALTANRSISVIATIPVGASPDGVAANRKTDVVYVTDGSAGTVSVINGRTNTVTATIPVGSGPNGPAVNTKTNTVYVAN